MLETKIAELTKAVEALTAQLVAAAPSAPSAPNSANDVPPQATKLADSTLTPAETPTLLETTTMSMDEMTRAALALSRDGKGDAVRAKLKEIGVARISLLDGDQIAQFAAFLGEVSE